MKKLIVLSVLLLLASCQEEVQSYNDLSPDEQAAINSQGQAQCLTNAEGNFTTYKTKSAEVFTSGNYTRGNGFSFTLKNGTTTFKTIDISVWKQTATEMYFLVTDSFASSGNYFLRITKAENDSMIDTMKTKYCERGDVPNKYTMGLTSSSLTATYETNNYITSGTNKNNYKDTYTMYFNELVQFATYRVGRSLKVTDQDGNQVGNTESYTSTFADKDVTFASADPNTYATTYCTIPTPYLFIKSKNFQGFYDPNAACTGSIPAGWNLTP